MKSRTARRIDRLIRIARSTNNPYEKELYEKVATLLAKKVGMPPSPDDIVWTTLPMQDDAHLKQKCDAINSVIEAVGCIGVLEQSGNQPTLHIVGIRSSVELLESLLPTVLGTMESMLAIAITAFASELATLDEKSFVQEMDMFARSYRHGIGKAIADCVRTPIPDDKRKQIEQEFANRFPCTEVIEYDLDAREFNAGYHAGKEAWRRKIPVTRREIEG